MRYFEKISGLPKAPLAIGAGAALVAVAAVATIAVRLLLPPVAAEAPREPVAQAQPRTPVSIAQTPAPTGQQTATASPADRAATAPPAASAATAAATPAAAAPSFDIVRVEPTGEAVIAGRTEPGAEVTLMDHGQAVASTHANGNGEFALVPSPLSKGAHELTLQGADATGPVQSRQSVTVAVPQTQSGGVIVALTDPDRPTQMLAEPKAAVAADAPGAAALPAGAKSAALSPPAAAPSDQVLVHTVEFQQGGGFFATGTAAPGAALQLYLNGSFVAAVTAGLDGRWSLTVMRGLAAGAYLVRADEVDVKTRRVISRAEVPFDYHPAAIVAGLGAEPTTTASPAATPPASAQVAAAPAATSVPAAETPPAMTKAPPAEAGNPMAVAAPAVESAPASPAASVVVAAAQAPAASTPVATAASAADAVVQQLQTTKVIRGDSLWRISRKVFGHGIRYTVLYEANAKQIRSPRLIYPGQVFVVPTDRG